MSQIPGQGEVGRLHVTISADGADTTKQALNEVGTAGENAGRKAESGFKSFAKSVKDPVNAIRGLMGSIGGAVAIVATLKFLFDQLHEKLKSAATKAEEFSESIAGKDATSRIAALNTEIDTLNSKLADLTSGFDRRVAGYIRLETEGKIKELVSLLDAQRRAAIDQQKAQELQRRRDADAKEAARLEKDNADRQSKYLADLFDEVRLVKELRAEEEARNDAIKERTRLLREQFQQTEKDVQGLLSVFDASSVSSDIGRIANLVSALIAQRR